MYLEIDPEVVHQIVEAMNHIARDSPDRARQWVDQLHDKIEAIVDMPHSYSFAREQDAFRGIELRQFVHQSHRVIFAVGTHKVRVLRIQHTAMQDWDPSRP